MSQADVSRAGNPIVIIGGGLAGLTAAVALARAGHPVSLLERSTALGGRARTTDVEGFRLNLGPHALYPDAEDALGSLGVEVGGGRPPASAALWTGAGFTPLPATPGGLLRTPLLGWRGRAQLVRFLARVRSADAASFSGLSTSELLEAWVPDARALALAKLLVRLSTYCADTDALSADAALAQVQLSLRGGVRYLDGGWGSLVDELAARATALGTRLRPGCVVEALRRDGAGWELTLRGAPPLHAAHVVLALPAQQAARLLPGEAGAARRAAAEARPLHAACLDVALSAGAATGALPVPERAFALGVDEPLYFADHARVARLAPGRGAVLHAARYLREGEEASRASLEAFVDAVQPGWRRSLQGARFLPRMLVQSALPSVAGGGLAGRPGARACAGLYLAGDWVGPRGLLASASVLSALDAAAALLEDAPPVRQAARVRCEPAAPLAGGGAHTSM